MAQPLFYFIFSAGFFIILFLILKINILEEQLKVVLLNENAANVKLIELSSKIDKLLITINSPNKVEGAPQTLFHTSTDSFLTENSWFYFFNANSYTFIGVLAAAGLGCCVYMLFISSSGDPSGDEIIDIVTHNVKELLKTNEHMLTRRIADSSRLIVDNIATSTTELISVNTAIMDRLAENSAEISSNNASVIKLVKIALEAGTIS